MPFSSPEPDNEMRHDTVLVRPVPMCRAGLSPNNITSSQTLWDPSFVTNPSVPRDNPNELAFLVSVPVRAGARGKGDICDGCVGVEVDGIKVDVAGECFGRFDAFRGLLVAAFDDY